MAKKLIILIAIVISGISYSSAGIINYGVKGGINFSNLSGKDWHAASYYKTSFHAGAFLDVNLLGIIGVETGLYFSQKGWVDQTKDGDENIIQQSSFTYNYLDIPVLLRFKPIPLVSLFVGPQASVYLNNNYVITDSEGEENTYTEEHDDYGFTNPDFAFVIGTHTNLPLGIFLSASYDIGLTSLYTNDQKIYNRTIKVSVGYKF